MEWYIPLTIIPGAGFIVMSTSNIMLALNTEISSLVSQGGKFEKVIQLKLAQLKRLSVSIVFQYVGVCLFLVSGISSALFPQAGKLPGWILLSGVFVLSFSILLLLVYSVKAVTIRQQHLRL